MSGLPAGCWSLSVAVSGLREAVRGAPQPSEREGALGLEGFSAYVAMIKDLFISPFGAKHIARG